MSNGRRRLRAGTTSAANPRLLNDPPARSHPRRVTNSHTMGSTPMPPFTRPDACSAAFVFAPRRRLRSSDPPAAALPTSLSHGAHGRVAQPLSGQTTAPAGNRRPSPAPSTACFPSAPWALVPQGRFKPKQQRSQPSDFGRELHHITAAAPAAQSREHRGGQSGNSAVRRLQTLSLRSTLPTRRPRRGSIPEDRLGTFACTELP